LAETESCTDLAAVIRFRQRIHYRGAGEDVAGLDR